MSKNWGKRLQEVGGAGFSRSGNRVRMARRHKIAKVGDGPRVVGGDQAEEGLA